MRTSKLQQMGKFREMTKHFQSNWMLQKSLCTSERARMGSGVPMAGSSPPADHHRDASWTKCTLLYKNRRKLRGRKRHCVDNCRVIPQQVQGGSLVSRKVTDHRSRITPDCGHAKVGICKRPCHLNCSYKQRAIKSIHSWRLEQPHFRVKSNEELNHTDK